MIDACHKSFLIISSSLSPMARMAKNTPENRAKAPNHAEGEMKRAKPEEALSLATSLLRTAGGCPQMQSALILPMQAAHTRR